MQGITVFPNVQASIDAGYHKYDSHHETYPGSGVYVVLMRMKTPAGFVLAHAKVAYRDEIA
ncbi:MAG: hypothetical protein KGL39_34310 [Patescibacteria group bacterium]|nr:hypothetical protein [Patescibacteria group bacterium]